MDNMAEQKGTDRARTDDAHDLRAYAGGDPLLFGKLPMRVPLMSPHSKAHL